MPELINLKYYQISEMLYINYITNIKPQHLGVSNKRCQRELYFWRLCNHVYILYMHLLLIKCDRCILRLPYNLHQTCLSYLCHVSLA